MEPIAPLPGAESPAQFAARLADRLTSGLAGQLGIELVEARPGHLTVQLAVTDRHMAANGYLHAGTVVALADTACGFGCFASLPAGAHSFTTVELKSNFLRTVGPGAVIRAEARLVHGGRRTQVWDATVFTAEQKPLALFRCTQMLIYGEPRPHAG